MCTCLFTRACLYAQGWLLQSELYYGGYHNKAGVGYNMQFAYFFTVIVCYIIYLVVIARRLVAVAVEALPTRGGSAQVGSGSVVTYL